MPPATPPATPPSRTPLRVALLVFNQPGRGTYWRAWYLGRELSRRGHTVTLLATAPRERRRFRVSYAESGRLALVEAPDLLRGSLRSGWDAWASLARCAWLAQARIDLVHAFECRPSVLVPALFAKARGAPLVLDWCDWFGRGGSVEERPAGPQRAALRPVETFFEERFRTRADATTVINRFLGQRAAALGVPPETITLLPNGCDTDGWELEPRQSARAALGLPANAPLVCYVGAIFRRDADLLARAFDQLAERCPAVRLLVLGYCNVAVERLVRHPARVLRTGPLEANTLRRYMRASDLGLVPLCDSGANRGRWPLKVSSYMEAGLPFVTTAVGDLPAFVARYPAGVAAPPTPEGIAEAVLGLLGDGARAASLGARGRQLAETELSWASMALIVERLYQRLLDH